MSKALRSKSSDTTLTGLLWIAPWIVGFVVFLAVPVGMSLYYSLTEYSLLEPPAYIGAENYVELFSDARFWRSIINTAIYAFVSVVLGTVLAIGLAVLLNQKLPAIGLARSCVFLPTLVPLVAASLGWMWLYNDEFGLFNIILRAVGLPTPDWLGAEGWAMASLIIMGLWYVGGAMVIYLAALRDVPQALYDASAIDGVSPMRRFWHVTLPMISPAVLFNVVMGIIWSIQVFAVPYIMTKGGPDDATLFYTMYLYDNAFVFGRMGYASAMAWIQFLAIVVLTGGMFLLARKFVYYRAA